VNALWISHTWVGDPHTDSEYKALAELLVSHEISDALFHAGPFDSDGSVPDHLIAHVDQLLVAMDEYAPGVRTQAYLGQIEARAGGPLDLDDPGVRDGMIETAEHFLDLGFDGIHYDIEPVFPGDENFLELLERTRALTEPRGATLSVALEQLEVIPGQGAVSRTLGRDYADSTVGYLRDVAQFADQVAIMTYDTGLPVDWLFGAHMAWQTEWTIAAIGEDATIFMGVPTYDEGGAWRFHPRAENMATGIRGVRKGLDRFEPAQTQQVGLGIYAEWTTSDEEWEDYADAWLSK
jgi:hypothetical protein